MTSHIYSIYTHTSLALTEHKRPSSLFVLRSAPAAVHYGCRSGRGRGLVSDGRTERAASTHTALRPDQTTDSPTPSEPAEEET